MRIIAGKYRGRLLQAVPGDSTRPTTDRTREAWASTIGSLLPHGFEGLRVLDVFAGSGALGIEALSRGADSAVFCENGQRALTVLKKNLSIVEDPTKAVLVLAVDVFSLKALRLLKEAGPYQLVLLDPPYSTPRKKVESLLYTLVEAKSIRPGALVSYEHKNNREQDLGGSVLRTNGSQAGLSLVSCKNYGNTQIEYLCYQ